MKYQITETSIHLSVPLFPPSLYLSEGLGDGSGHLVFPGTSLLPLLHHLSSIHQQLGFPLAERQVFVDGSHLVLTIAAGIFFGFYIFQHRDAIFWSAGPTEESKFVLGISF